MLVKIFIFKGDKNKKEVKLNFVGENRFKSYLKLMELVRVWNHDWIRINVDELTRIRMFAH